MPPADAQFVATQIHRVLDEIFHTPGKFAITNDSFRVLANGLWSRLDTGLAKYPAERVFKTALAEHAPNLRNEIWSTAQEGMVSFPDGTLLPLMTESRAAKVLLLCPPKPKW